MNCRTMPRSGYEGQQYEVRATVEGVPGKTIGWINDPTGGGLVEMVKLHPSMSDPVVIDLWAEGKP